MTKQSHKSVTVWEGNIPVESSYTSGVAGEKTLRALKEQGVFIATECPDCQVTYFPARLFCERCFANILNSEKAVGPEGTLESWTSVSVDANGKKLKNPQVFGLIKLDGTNTFFLHKIQKGLSPKGTVPMSAGKRVSPVLKAPSNRRGSITDILAFEVLG